MLKNIVIALCMVFSCSIAHARTVLIEKGADGHPVVTSQPALSMSLVDKIGDLPNDRFYYGTVGEIEGGVNVKFGRVEPYGRIAEHAGSTNYILYVIKGSGSLVNTDGKGTEVSRFEFNAGDVIIFKPDTMHFWETGAEAWEFIGVEQKPTS